MTKQVALANVTYDRLRRRRLEGESFSQAIDRLLDGAKDPLGFAARVPKSSIPAAERLRQIEEDRNNTWTDA